MMKIDLKNLSYQILSEVCPLMSEKTYFVGGFVRDIILGRNVKDIDIVTFDMDYKELARLIKVRLDAIAVSFKDNVRIIKDDFIIDVSKPRGAELNEDLQKRDFTINNLALTKEGEVIGNVDDLHSRLIRHVYSNVFIDDSIRILRAFRFVSQLGFTIVKETVEKIIREKDLLKEAPLERVFDELIKLLDGEYCFEALTKLQETEILFVLFPEFKKIEGLPQGKYHKDCALTHTFRVVNQVNMMTKILSDKDTRTVLLLTALFHDVGKGFTGPKNNFRNFVGHEQESAKIAKKYLYSFPIKRKVADRILKLIENHSRIRIYATEGARDFTLKSFIYENRDILEDLIIFTLADNLTKGRDMSKLYETIIRIRDMKEKMSWENENLINGFDLIDMGLTQKERFSEILTDVKKKLVIGELEDKQSAIDYIKRKYL